MQWHEFIFSGRKNIRISRHLAFWAISWFYFFLCYYLYEQPLPATINFKPFYLALGDHLSIKVSLLVLFYALACYPLIYFILPQILKGKWLRATASLALVFSLLLITTYFLYWNGFSYIDLTFGSSVKSQHSLSHFWPPINLGLINFMKVGAAALAIKYVKYLWFKQKEKEKLEREKLKTELQLLKAQIKPAFLFNTLEKLYTHAVSSSSQTPGMLLKLSDLLSYALYECDKTLVPLEREIAMMKEYMELEQIKQNGVPEMEIHISGSTERKEIAPFLLFPFIEKSFSFCNSTNELSWINMNLEIEEDVLTMKLANSIPETKDLNLPVLIEGMEEVQKRLTLLYPETHELKITSEQEMLIVVLKVRLHPSISKSFVEEEDAHGLLAALYQ